jgi:hypothetical protein
MSERHIELVACLHHARYGQALMYVRIDNAFFRLNKERSNPQLDYIEFGTRAQCVDDARNITRYSPEYLHYDSIRNAPLSQIQLERMILKLQAMGHLTNEQRKQAF